MDLARTISLDSLPSIIDSLAANIYVVTRDFRIEWTNLGTARSAGKRDSADLTGKHCYLELYRRTEACPDCPMKKTVASGKTEQAEIQIEGAGQVTHWLLTSVPLLRKNEDAFSLVIMMAQDVTDQKRAEGARLGLSEFNKAIIDNAPVAIFTLDSHGVFTSINPTLASMSGLGADAGRKLLGFNWLTNPYTVACGLADYMKKALNGEPFELHDFPFITYRGDKHIYLDFKGVPLRAKNGSVEGLLCIIEEATERVKTRTELIQEAKMSAIGRLATGVAHELNNPLATMAAHSELALDLLQSSNWHLRNEEMEELEEHLRVIQEHTFRCKHIITELFHLSQRGFESIRVDLRKILNEALETIGTVPANLRVLRKLQRRLPTVTGDPSALRQCFVNLVRNAIDAMEGRAEPTLQVRARTTGNGFVAVEIEDNGCGIPADVGDKIFDPFFTTKGARKGVGIGLTLCFEFVSRMGGKIEVESEEGKGTLFRVLLPVGGHEQQG
jgi:two-component system, sporulation sensor kinase E